MSLETLRNGLCRKDALIKVTAGLNPLSQVSDFQFVPLFCSIRDLFLSGLGGVGGPCLSSARAGCRPASMSRLVKKSCFQTGLDSIPIKFLVLSSLLVWYSSWLLLPASSVLCVLPVPGLLLPLVGLLPPFVGLLPPFVGLSL